jgi:lipoprotein-anchoring transpeptidase ErfK/SrfK
MISHPRTAALLAAAGLCAALLASCSHPSRPASAPATTPTTVRPAVVARTVPAPTTTRPAAPADWTLVATTHGAIPRYSYPGGPIEGTVPGSWHGAPSTLPVIGSRPGWLDVRLAQRPNESTAWVHARDVTLASTPYRIVVDLATTHLLLYRSGHLVLSVPAGIGTAAYPTPTGSYFLAFLAAPPSPGYGAFVMVTSAHSNAITDWEDSGDAIVAIHGPLGSDSEIGTTGAAVSHGCVRLHESDLLELRDVPDGSPIDIVAS